VVLLKLLVSPGGFGGLRTPLADHELEWKSLERFVSRAIASSIFTSTSHHHIAFLPSPLQIYHNLRYMQQ
jgi:hypothetical protein